MSYNISIRAASKAEAKVKVAAELARILETQPVHALDLPKAEETADAFIDMVPDDDTMHVQVSVSGSLSWRGTYPVDHTITGGSFGCSAALVTPAT